MSIKRYETKTGYPNLEVICRLCLEQETGTIDIFDSGQLSIPVRIMACAALEVLPTDGLPKFICENCRFQLEKSYYFRKKCQQSDVKLRKHIRLHNAGKKSRVFLKANDDDDDENDLQYEESLRFIAAEEKKLAAEEEAKRLKWLAEQQKQFRKEETQRLFEEFENFMNTRKPIDRTVVFKKEIIDLEGKDVLPLKTLSLLSASTSNLKSEGKRSRMKIIPRKLPEGEPDTGADNAITSSENISDEQEQILIYNDEEGENTDGAIQTFFLYGKDDEEGHSQIIEIESQRLEELEEELSHNVEDDAVEEGNVDVGGVNDEEGSEDFLFPHEYEECDNRDEDGNRIETVNVVESYQIEDNGEIQYLKDEQRNESLSISDEDDVRDIFANPDIPQYEIEQNIIMPSPKAKKKRKPDSSSTLQLPKRTKSPAIAMHLSRITTEDLKIFKCSECPQSFTRETSLLRHSSAHKKGREYSCDNCDKWFSCKSSLDRHMRIHTGEKPFTCDQCGKSYMQKEVLKRHLAIHSGERPHPCPHCPRAFVQKLMLTQHINATHLEVPQIQKHDCHLCPKSFHHASGLSRHLLTHSGMKFCCSECGRSFNDKSSIRRHVMSVHSKHRDSAIISATNISTKCEPNEESTEYII